MASDFLGSYDPKEVSLILSGLTVTGYYDGTFITCAKMDKEIYKKHVGAHGEVGRTKNNNNAGTITVVLKKTSPFNKTLDLLKRSLSAFPVMCKNNSDSQHLAIGTSAWVETDPDIEHADEESSVEWVIGVADLTMSHF